MQCHAQEQTKQNQNQAQTQTQDPEQSVAEVARQERTRRQNQQKKTRHVYTSEELKREQILTPEDHAEFEARKNQQPAAPASPAKLQHGASGTTVAQNAHAASPSANSADVPLGEIARRLRREKESQQLQRSAEFPLPFADAPVLASPKPPTQPLLPSVTVAPPTVVVPAPRVVAPWRPFVKRSPSNGRARCLRLLLLRAGLLLHLLLSSPRRTPPARLPHSQRRASHRHCEARVS